MEMKFYCDRGVISLEEYNVAVQETNARLSDSLFTKFTLPFQIHITPEITSSFGDFLAESGVLPTSSIKGHISHEGKIHEAELHFLGTTGKMLKLQIDFGLEDVPNFNKKLSELTLENFEVEDIHLYAKTTATKKYPETNFNFPRIYTSKYSGNDMWKNFDGYLNDLKRDGSEMRRNYIDEAGNIFNVNIIHPCPHVLYLLKAGFEDAGYQLTGSILHDNNLAQKWIYSGTEYFSRLTQNRQGLRIIATDYTDKAFGLCYFRKKLIIEKPGKYIVTGCFKTTANIKGSSVASINLNNVQIYNVSKESYKALVSNFNINVSVTLPNTELEFLLMDSYSNLFTEEVILVDVINTELANESQYEGEDVGVITNLNRIELNRAVPDITFGEFVRIIKNWFNYDIDIFDKKVVMNLVQSTVDATPIDLQFLEVPQEFVERTFSAEKSYLLKFADLDKDEKKDSIYFDSKGIILNGKEQKDTQIIEINGYIMPVRSPKAQGYNTATVLKDSSNTLALVNYEGLVFGQNNSLDAPEAEFPALFHSNWKDHLRQRLRGHEYSWSTMCPINQIAKVSIKDKIFCYNNIHHIKSWSKQRISADEYEIEITTESII